MDCPANDDAKCTAIDPNMYLSGIACKPVTDCDALGEIEIAKATAAAHAQCGDGKECQCANGGSADTGKACPTNDDMMSASCSGEYSLDGKGCNPPH
jgi:hypothetical protein